MNNEKVIAPAAMQARDSRDRDDRGEKMTIAGFAVPERVSSASVDRARERLGHVGVLSYVVELAGSDAPTLDIDGATYVGDGEIGAAVDELVASRGRG